ncbi:MAG: FIST C-terminal domain-containing protein [Lachnospiraceae bacterium]|nr:FIST C-terminal domain-containing protein [Lachnospiraceae bacterium]
MNYHIGSSHVSSDIRATVGEACAGFNDPKLILFWSPVDHFEEYAREIKQRFPRSISMGATCIMSINNKGASKNELLCVGIESGITCAADVLDEVDRFPIKYSDRVEKCVKEVGNNRNTLCLEFTSAFLCAEESVLATLNSVLLPRGIPVVGGTAGNNAVETITKVALNGIVRERTSVFCIIHNEGGAIHFYRENIYKPVPGMNDMIATRVDIKNRVVKEYDHIPAAEAFSRALGVPESSIATYFDTHPLGRVAGDELFITANQEATSDRGMSYHARVYSNTRMKLLEPDDYRRVNKETCEIIKKECPSPSFAIMIHCLARTLLFNNEGYMQEFARLMGSVLGSYVGFSGYGEQLKQHHFNQTAIMVVFE